MTHMLVREVQEGLETYWAWQTVGDDGAVLETRFTETDGFTPAAPSELRWGPIVTTYSVPPPPTPPPRPSPVLWTDWFDLPADSDDLPLAAVLCRLPHSIRKRVDDRTAFLRVDIRERRILGYRWATAVHVTVTDSQS